MSRPRKVNRSINVHLMLPEDLVAQVNLALVSPLQERIPLGAVSAFYERAARKELEWLISQLKSQESNTTSTTNTTPATVPSASIPE